MKNKMNIKYIPKFLLVAVAFMAMMSSCKDEVTISQDYTDFQPGYYTLRVPVDVLSSDVQTRASFAESSGTVTLQDVWIGIYDPVSDKLIGSAKKTLNTSSIPSHSQSNGYVDIENVYFNDVHPNVKVVGVANFAGVMATNSSLAGELMPLTDLLDEAQSWQDVIDLTVDAKSAEEAAASSGTPLMSGFFSYGHMNAAVSHDGSVNSENVYLSLFTDETGFKGVTLQAEGNVGSNNASAVHLRTLVTHVNVEVKLAEGITFLNPAFQLHNLPATAYLFEHQLNSSYPEGTEWSRFTAASSDLYDNGYISSPVFVPGQSTTENDVFEVKASDAMSVNGNTITFSYWHYENKHWGLGSLNKYADREVIENNIFTNLCGNAGELNNKATYFLLKGYVVDANNNIEGNVEYLIHEGYCTDINGNGKNSPTAADVIDEATAAKDFSTFRNTRYYYTITVNGLKSIVVKAEKEDDINNGANGSVSKLESLSLQNEDGLYPNVSLSAGALNWVIFEYDPNTKETVSFGLNPSGFTGYEGTAMGKIWNGANSNVNSSDVFYQGIKIGNSYLKDLTSLEAGTYDIELPVIDDNIFRVFYLAGATKTSEDIMSTYTPVYAFGIEGIKFEKDAFHYLKQGDSDPAFVLSPFLKWNKVSYADSYVISIDNTVIQTINDWATNEYTLPLRANYADAIGSHTVTIKAVSSIDLPGVNESSDSFTFSVEPRVSGGWDFSIPDWNDIKSGITSDGADFVGHLKGLDIIAGGAALAQGTNYIQTGGAGSMSKRVFSFNAYFPGRIEIRVSTTGGSDNLDRMLNVQVGEDPANTQTQVGGYKTSNIQTLTFQITPETYGSKVYIYSNPGSLRIYSIKYVPS